MMLTERKNGYLRSFRQWTSGDYEDDQLVAQALVAGFDSDCARSCDDKGDMPVERPRGLFFLPVVLIHEFLICSYQKQ